MDLQIREAVEIYGSTKYISTENLLSAVLIIRGTVNSFAQISSDILAEV